MPARIVVVQDDVVFLAAIEAALRAEGHDVAAFSNSLLAWDALASRNRVEVLITRIRFPAGQPHGVALSHQARMGHPGVRVLFTALPEFRCHTEGLGTFLPLPVSPPDVVLAVSRLLANAVLPPLTPPGSS
jgi:DNA-binding NtrC family response regulator